MSEQIERLLMSKILRAEDCEPFAKALCGTDVRCDPSKLYRVTVSDNGDFTSAQSELAALRGELANTTAMLEAERKWFDKEIDSADEETSSLRECIRDLKDWRENSHSFAAFESIIARAGSIQPSPGPLRKALIAAEQRNVELITILTEFVTLQKSDYEIRGGVSIRWKPLIDRAEAALNPTKSVASE